MPDEQTATTSTETTGTTEAKSEDSLQTNILADAEDKKTDTASQETSAETKSTEEGEKKDEGEKKSETKAPEAYEEFKLPEGTTLDEQGMTDFKGLAKELDLTQDQAQKMLDFGGDKIKALAEAPYRLWAETQAKWQAEVKADPEIGGTRFADSIAAAAKVFEVSESNPFVGSVDEAKTLREALNMTGAGNNPAIVKMFVKMGKLLSEPGGLSGNPVKQSQESLLDKLYPTMT
jgi:hypothetical protein